MSEKSYMASHLQNSFNSSHKRHACTRGWRLQKGRVWLALTATHRKRKSEAGESPSDGGSGRTIVYVFHWKSRIKHTKMSSM